MQQVALCNQPEAFASVLGDDQSVTCVSLVDTRAVTYKITPVGDACVPVVWRDSQTAMFIAECSRRLTLPGNYSTAL